MNLFRIQTVGWRLAAAALLLWGLPGACFAANDYWTNTAGGSFSNAVNWSPGLPGAADAAYFTNAASYTVNWSAGASNANVYYDAGGGVVTQNMGSAAWVVTGLYDVGKTSGKTGVVVQVGGYVEVSNVADSVRIGDSGNGSYTLNGGVLVARNTLVGYASDNNTMLVTGSGAVMTNTSYTYIGSSGSGNLFTLANSGMVVTAYGVIGPTAGKNGNRLVITDPGTVWTNTASAAGTPFSVGNGAAANSLVVSNGGQLFSAYTSIGNQVSSSNNSALVTGTGSTWTVVGSGSTIRVGESGSSNQLTIANGGKMVLPNHFYVGWQAASSNNLVTVTGAGSVLTNAPNMDVVIGQSGVGNRLVVSNGGKVYMSNGFAILGANASSSSNTALITDTGSLWRNSTRFDIGQNGSKDNTLVVSNGGQMVIGGISYLGETVASTGNRVILTGAGSLYQAGGAFNVGSNATTKGAASVLVTDRATLEANTLVGGWNGTGTITNFGGVYQFTAAPNITNNGYGNITLSNGWISFLGINNADVMGSLGSNQLANISFIGSNTFRLNNSSNTSAASPQNYTFGGSSPSNYVGLEMINGGTAWKSAWLNIGNNGTMLASNTAAKIDGVFTNSGGVTVGQAALTFNSNVVLSSGSRYLSLGGTNTFSGGLSIGAGASFSLDASSTFSVLGNYQNLGSAVFSNQYTVVGGNRYKAWGVATNQFAGGLTINSGAGFDVTNGVSVIGGTITNAGTMTVMNSRAIYNGNVVNQGAYVSDPSTNTFNGNYTVGPTGYVFAASNDVYAFGGDFILQSTNRTAFNLAQARVVFATNGYDLATTTRLHTLNLTNSGAVDKGSNWINHLQLQTNFSIGTLTIALSNQLTITGVKGTNALYVGVLDLSAWSTNAGADLNATLLAALNLTDINVYYDKYAAENAYLQGLEFSVWGAGNGLLIPIPEPSVLGAAALGLTLLAFFRRKDA